MAQQTLHTVISIGGNVDNTFGKIGDALINLGNQANLVSQKIIGFGKESLNEFIDYDDLMRQAQAVGEFSDAEIEALNVINKEIAQTTVFTNKQAAEAEVIMGQYGLSVDNIKELLPSVLELAMAGNISVKDSIDYLYSSLSSLGLGMDYAGTLTDQMAKTAAIGATDVNTLGDSLMRLGSGAQMFTGGSVEILAVLSAMSRFGEDQRGAAAGTWLRNFMLSLAAPTGDVDGMLEAMEQLGIAQEEIDEYADSKNTGESTAAINSLVEDGLRIYDEKGKLLPAIDIIRSLRDTVRGNGDYASDFSELSGALAQTGGDIEAFMTSTEGMTDNALYSVFRQIFGRRGIATALNLISITDEEWNAYFNDITNSGGFAQGMGEIMQGGIGGAIRELGAAWDEFKTTVGEAISPTVQGIADWLRDVVVSLSNMDKTALDSLITGFAAIAAVGPGMLLVGGVMKAIGFLLTPGGAIALGAVGLTALAVHLHNLAETEWRGNFGTLQLDFATLKSYADNVTTSFDAAKDKLAEFDTELAKLANTYQETSTQLSSDIITDVITGRELTEEDKLKLQGYGETVIRAVKDGILLKQGRALKLTDILFGDMQTPEEVTAFTNLTSWNNGYYTGLYEEAEAIGQTLRSKMVEALQDNSLDAGDRRAIQSQIERLNEIQAQISAELNKQNYYTQLHKAQNLSWDTVEEYVTSNKAAMQAELDALDAWWHTSWGESKTSFEYAKENGFTDANGVFRLATDDDWANVEAELNRKYLEYTESTKNKYAELSLAAVDTLMQGNDYSNGWEVLGRLGVGVSTETALEILNRLVPSGELKDNSLFYNIRRASMADSGLVSYWMQYYNKTTTPEMKAAFDQIVPALEREYDFKKVLEGDTAAVASSAWWKQYAAYKLLLGDASSNPDAYRYGTDTAPYIDDIDPTIGSFTDKRTPIDIVPKIADGGADMRTELEKQGVAITVTGDTTDLSATIDAEDGKTLLEYLSGDATDLSMTIYDLDGNILTENVTGDASSLSDIIDSYNGKTVTVNIHGREMFASGGRASQASIFGEAGPEWAIPEEHSARTASLLNAAREASGFTWPELLARNGGMNANPGRAPGQLVYSPTIYANDATGVDDKLKEDKERLKKWFDDMRLHDDVEVYA